MFKVYWNYFKYIIQHKWFVGIECVKMGMFWHAITHDLSKFLPSEFFPYADKFFSGDYAYRYHFVEMRFAEAWLHHQHRNRHHWDYWVNSSGTPMPIPRKYIKQMVADWRGMARKFGDTARSFYEKNKSKMVLNNETVIVLEKLLGPQ